MQPVSDDLPDDVYLTKLDDGNLFPSKGLSELLINYRNGYDWPSGTGPTISQATIVSLENDVSHLNQSLNESSAHEIIVRVSFWAGNNARAHGSIVSACHSNKKQMLDAIMMLKTPASLRNGIDLLSNLPGVGLVIATKIYRFVCPLLGAAVDRHASYFFNSLDIHSARQVSDKALSFRREWAKAGKSTSRLATYTPSGYSWNRDQYISRYLPLLSSIATSLNMKNITYQCAATGHQLPWRPTDIEMAAYYWWASNGSR